MSGGEQTLAGESDEELLQACLGAEVDGRSARDRAVFEREILAARERAIVGRGCAEQEDGVALAGERGAERVAGVVEQANGPDDGRGVDGLTLGLVVERDVPTHDGHAQGAASVGHATDALLQLVVDLRLLRVAEVEAVGDGQRRRAGCGDVAARLGDGHRTTGPGVEPSEASIAVDSQGERLGELPEAEHSGISRTGLDHRARLHLVVVAAVDGALARDVGGGEERTEDASRLRGAGRRGHRGGVQGVEVRGARSAGAVLRRLDERRDVDLGGEFGAVIDPRHAVAGDGTDSGERHVPAVEDATDGVLVLRFDDEEHALLGLGEHDLVGSHAVLAAGDAGHVYLDAGAAPRGALHHGARESRRAEVLHSVEQPACGGFEAGLDEHLLQERVADLDGGAHLALFLEGAGGEAGRAVDAVPAGGGAREQKERTGVRSGGPHESSVRQQANAHRINEGVAAVGGGEHRLASHVRHADAVAVAGDAGDDTLEEVAVARGVQRAEAQRVQERDGARAHREDVADDAADARRGALVRLDGRWVVVRLDLEDDGEPAANVDNARVLLAGLHAHRLAGSGEAAQQGLGVLIAAVLTPERAEQPQLDAVGFALNPADDEVVLLTGEGDLVKRFL